MGEPRTKAELMNSERAQCRKCLEVFSRTSNFERHRKNGDCVDPSSVGLIIKVSGENSWWQMPGNGFTFPNKEV